MSGFTKGPWNYQIINGEHWILQHNFNNVANLIPKNEVLANGNLISAAPELYEALEWAMARIKEKAMHSFIEGQAELYNFAKAEAALKKARGEA